MFISETLVFARVSWLFLPLSSDLTSREQPNDKKMSTPCSEVAMRNTYQSAGTSGRRFGSRPDSQVNPMNEVILKRGGKGV